MHPSPVNGKPGGRWVVSVSVWPKHICQEPRKEYRTWLDVLDAATYVLCTACVGNQPALASHQVWQFAFKVPPVQCSAMVARVSVAVV